MEIDGNHNVVTSTAPGKAFTFTQGADIKDLQIISTEDNTKWNSSYGIHIYTDKGSISNVSVHGFNAAMLINGGTAKLSGNIDVSGNTFGGIEVSKGKSTSLSTSVLDITDAKITNTSEEYGKPTIWIDGTSDEIGQVIGAESFTKVEMKNQIHYYIHSENAQDPNA